LCRSTKKPTVVYKWDNCR